jgi:hypothetical protein
MLETIRGIWALLLVVCEQLRDEVLGDFGDALPVVTGEGDFTCTDSFHDVVVGLAGEWRRTAQ